MSLYVAPMGMGGDDKKDHQAQRDFDQAIMASSADPDEFGPERGREPNFEGGHVHVLPDDDVERAATAAPVAQQRQRQQKSDRTPRVKDPLTFLYYSIVLTTLTVICAVIIGIIQLLTMILNVATPHGKFWDGVEVAGDNYEIIGGAICASFIVFGGISVLCYKPWRRWVDRKGDRLRSEAEATDAGGHERRERDFILEDEVEDLVSPPDHGEAEELVEVQVQGKTPTERVGVKAWEADDENMDIPGASGGTR